MFDMRFKKSPHTVFCKTGTRTVICIKMTRGQFAQSNYSSAFSKELKEDDGKYFYRKIVDLHTIKNIDDDTVLLYVDAHFANEYTSPQAFAGLRERG